jgi:hypothetical protein
MARKKKVKAAAPAPPPPPPPIVEAAPAPDPGPPPPEPDNALRNGQRPIAQPQPVLPDNPDAILNNVLCREINDPSPGGEEAPDPHLTILAELTKGLTHGSDLNHVREDVFRIASNQQEKVNVIKSILRGVDMNRVSDFVSIRAVAEKALLKAAHRGDLKSTEYLTFLRYASTGLDGIMKNLSSDEVAKAAGNDSASMIERMDHTRQAQEDSAAKELKGVTPFGGEIIRRQIFKMEKALKKMGKLKTKEDGSKPDTAHKK